MNKVVPRSNPPFVGALLRVFVRGGVYMSGEDRRFNGWLLPVLVVAVGAYCLYAGAQGGTLSAARLRPVNWVGIAALAAGAACALAGKRPVVRLLGVLAAGIGAILVICL